jgi:hypothetical protein
VGEFVHPCEGEAVCKLTNEKVPYFNGPIFLENKTQVGKVEEIFGPINKAVRGSLAVCLPLVHFPPTALAELSHAHPATKASFVVPRASRANQTCRVQRRSLLPRACCTLVR